MSVAEKCNEQDCENDAIAFLVWRPGALMVLDGGLSTAARCGAHPVARYEEQIRNADSDAVTWVFQRGDGRPLTSGPYTAV